MDTKEGMGPVSIVDELVEIGSRMKRDKERLVEICSQIAAGTADRGASETRTPRKSIRGRRAPAGRPAGKTAGADGAGRVKPEPWRKVLCSRCGTKTGAIRKGPGAGELYPSRHRDGAGQPCVGVEQPAKLVVED